MILSYFAVSVFTLRTRFPLLSGGPICPFLAIFLEGTESCSENLYLCLHLNVLSTFSFDSFRVWGLMSKPLIHLELSSAKISDKDQISFFYSSAVPRHHVWISGSSEVPLHHVWILGSCVKVRWLQLHDLVSGSALLLPWSTRLVLGPGPCCFSHRGSVV